MHYLHSNGEGIDVIEDAIANIVSDIRDKQGSGKRALLRAATAVFALCYCYFLN